MADASDLCADCGHMRVDHGAVTIGLGCRCLVAPHQYCLCPAFDEGAVRTPARRPEHLSIANDLADDFCSKLPDYRNLRGTVASVAMDALARIDTTRSRSAERAVIEAARAIMPVADSLSSMAPRERWRQIRTPLADALQRLDDLREQARAEECGVVSGGEQDYGGFRCHLPRGHEGEHETELGTWRWA